jgi:pyocin large subunit-like protein
MKNLDPTILETRSVSARLARTEGSGVVSSAYDRTPQTALVESGRPARPSARATPGSGAKPSVLQRINPATDSYGAHEEIAILSGDQSRRDQSERAAWPLEAYQSDTASAWLLTSATTHPSSFALSIIWIHRSNRASRPSQNASRAVESGAIRQAAA